MKKVEKRLADSAVVLESSIVSNTPSHVMRRQWDIDKGEMLERHIVLQEEDRDPYIGCVLGASAGAKT